MIYKIIIIFFINSMIAFGAIYSYFNEEGNKIYTDKIPKDKKIKVSKIKEAIKVTTINPYQQNMQDSNRSYINVSKTYVNDFLFFKDQKWDFKYQTLKIISPVPNFGASNYDGEVYMNIYSEPSLLPGHNYRVLLDEVVIKESDENEIKLENLNKGSHSLKVEIIDENKNILEQTPEQPIHIHRLTKAQRLASNPCGQNGENKKECNSNERIKHKFMPFWPFD